MPSQFIYDHSSNKLMVMQGNGLTCTLSPNLSDVVDALKTDDPTPEALHTLLGM